MMMSSNASPEQQPPARLINLKDSLSGWKQRCYGAAGPWLEKTLGINYVNESYQRVLDDNSTHNFFTRSMRALNLAYEVSDADLEKIPKEGPVIVVSNHPYGALDGVALGALLTTWREDAKLMANYLLAQMDEIKPWIIQVDPFGGLESKRANFKGIKETIRFLREGGCIGTFPSGTVSHWHWRGTQVTDPQWLDNTARLVRQTKATVVPLYFDGHNSATFQMAGIINPRLRTMLLPRQMMRKRGDTLQVRIGQAISFRKLDSFATDREMMDYLRLSTYILRKRSSEGGESAKPRRFSFTRPAAKQVMVPIAEAIPKEQLKAEIDALPPERLLVSHSDFEVYWAFAGDIPQLLAELGRLREKTFREVGEGTGEATDLDRFDLHYRHLILWDKAASAIVGSYRMGLTDEILLTEGMKGLYTANLFQVKPEFFDKLGPAMEVGRSFIVAEYQRKHATLSLIWRGIGSFVCQHPEYKTLFGPVSISQEYNALSKDLMVKFLKTKKLDHELANYVRAKNPPKGKNLKHSEGNALASVRDIEDVSALISEIEHDQKGVPTLLKHYLKMNGVLVSFNVDEDFGNCIDGFIVVDLTQSDPKLLRAYLTPEGAEMFLQYHRDKDAAKTGSNGENKSAVPAAATATAAAKKSAAPTTPASETKNG